MTWKIRCILFSILSLFLEVFLASYAKAAKENSSADYKILSGFNGIEVLELIKTYDDVKTITLNTNLLYVKEGTSSLKINIVEDNDGRPGGDAIFDLSFPEVIDMSKYKSLSFWLYVPSDLIDSFYGRRDVKLFPNISHPHYTKDAVKSGWNKIIWSFKDLYIFPQMNKLRFQFGRILDGYHSGTIYIDDLKLEVMQPLEWENIEQLKNIVQNDKRWTRRYLAVKTLGKLKKMDCIPVLFAATADGPGDFGIAPEVASTTKAIVGLESLGSQVVRNAAYESLLLTLKNVKMQASAQIDNALDAVDMRIRQAAVKLIRDSPFAITNEWAVDRLKMLLLDDIYFVRKAAIETLESRDFNQRRIVVYLSSKLDSDNLNDVLGALRTLSEIGPPAKLVIPKLLELVRNECKPFRLRCWAVRAVWETDESYLEPRDWTVILGLTPGEVHRHLLNLAMDRLVEGGEQSVESLNASLQSEQPQVRARSASILSQIGKEAKKAAPVLLKALNDPKWYVRFEAAEALLNMGAYSEKAQDVIKEIQQDKNKIFDCPVKTHIDEQKVVFDNGIIELTFTENSDGPGPEIVTRSQWGQNLFDSDFLWQLFAYKNTPAKNIIEVPWFQKIFGLPIDKKFKGRVIKFNDDCAVYEYTFPAGADAPIEWKLCYQLRRGDSGFYWYVTSKNLSNRSFKKSINVRGNESLGSVRLLPAPTWNLYDTLMLHDNLKGPAKYTFNPQGFYSYPDIYQATYRLPSGQVDAKHEWQNYELESPVLGYCNKENGLWFIIPSGDSLDAYIPTQVNTSANHNIFVIFLEGKYYNNTAVRVTEDFEKLYGPFYWHINSGENREELWVDAKCRAREEINKWPYKWVENQKYHQRGTLKGKVTINGEHSPENAWVILSKPREDIRDDYYGEWMLNTNPYRYWTKTNSDGSFEINNIRPDNYDLFVWKPGIYGECQKKDIIIRAEMSIDVGMLILIPVAKGKLVWQIGVPNRTVTEYKNGNNFHQWDNFLRYRKDFPNDVNYIIGKSDFSKDWNYLHPETVKGEYKAVTWTVKFDLEKIPEGNPLLTIVYGGRDANLDIVLNGNKIGELIMDIKHIGANIRSAPYGELLKKEYEFNKNILVEGENTLLFTFDNSLVDEQAKMDSFRQSWYHHIGYDFIRLEMKN